MTIEAEPMTGEELKDARRTIGEAVLGRMLSLDETAKLCGMAPGNGADTIRKWQDGDGPTGPVAALLDIFCMAAEDNSIGHAMQAIITERLS